ncbi:regulator of microtubule dynamics protein 1-like isoform X1 [Anopheles bellator]|uniref:regulator of microtubule dynamics protein 1-like isoform X1 n=1 Tax=Anopheles bellator TaxID=139047 RepID=UPI0026489EC3|nr:regulator of microtubule dynamics protein 1-like isoform X1 [Anopheles bellator]
MIVQNGAIIIQRYGRLLIHATRLVARRTTPFSRSSRIPPRFPLNVSGARQKQSSSTVPLRPLLFVASFSLFSSKAKQQSENPVEVSGKMAEEVVRSLNETMEHADQLFDENNFQEAYDLLQKFPQQETYEIKWRLARVAYSLSKPAPSARKEELVREAFRYAEEALKMNDGDFAAHKWYSILLDAKSGLDGIKERITQLETVKQHMKRAVELNPTDPTSWYILGQFYYGLADLPWYQRKIVSTIFATPPTGTYEEALECFEKAEATKPNFYSMNHLMLGKTYQALKQADKAKEFMTLAANVAVLNEDDKQCKEEASKLLKKL